ncbi:hypothetical protein C8R46DRAFT_1283929 [Mycena filopes]|nr:hypothetical protein C8R46DRAFT_1283929 [Mycena filopes]
MSKLQNLETLPLALAPAPDTAALPLKVDVQDISGCTCGSRAQTEGNDCVLAPFHAPVCALPVPVPSRCSETHTSPSGVSGPNVLGSNGVELLVVLTAGSSGRCRLWWMLRACMTKKLMMEWLQGEIDSSDKLYLLHGRREPQKDKGPTQITSCMRHYLTMVKTQKHREAITSVLLSTHLLALEVLRYVDHAYQPVPRAERLCRFCRSEVESPEHALLTCESSTAVVLLRATFLAKLFTDLPGLRYQMAVLSNTEFLKAIISPRSTIPLVAKFAFDVLEVFYAVPTRLPLSFNSPAGLLGIIAAEYARTVPGSAAPAGSSTGSFATPTGTRSSARLRDRDGNDRPSGSNQHRGTRIVQGKGPRRLRDITDTVKVMYWNIFHNFTLKLTSFDFHNVLCEYDIMFFAETDMLPGEDEPADVPLGYTLLSLPRRPLMNGSRRGGGVALLIRDTFTFQKSNLSSPDILVLDMGTMWLIGAYIPPESSRWEGWTNAEPLQKLWETVALCVQSEDKHVALLSDINARTGSLQASSTRSVEWAKRWARKSADPDKKINTRGRSVIKEYEDDDWSDHMQICMTLDAAAFTQRPVLAQERQPRPEFGGSSFIDEFYQQTMHSKQTLDEALDSLWGLALVDSPPTHIYVEGTAAKGRKPGLAGAAKNMQLGWPGRNGDVFKSIVNLLATRRARTCFVFLDSKSNNEAKRTAYALAKSALNFAQPEGDFVAAVLPLPLDPPPTWPVGNLRKVYTTLEEVSAVKPKPWKAGEDIADKDPERSHRGRAKVHALQFALRQELLACKEPKEFWDFVRKRTDPRPKPAKVSLEDLSSNFKARLNHP